MAQIYNWMQVVGAPGFVVGSWFLYAVAARELKEGPGLGLGRRDLKQNERDERQGERDERQDERSARQSRRGEEQDLRGERQDKRGEEREERPGGGGGGGDAR
jgi:hypothetical protein